MNCQCDKNGSQNDVQLVARFFPQKVTQKATQKATQQFVEQFSCILLLSVGGFNQSLSLTLTLLIDF